MRQQLFEKEALIANSTSSGLMWCKPSQCVWKGPTFLTRKRVLYDTHCTQQGAEKLFRTFFNIADAAYGDILEDLALRATCSDFSNGSTEQILEAYGTLADMATSESAVKKIRLVLSLGVSATVLTKFSDCFDKKGLIYATGRWLTPSECVWNCAVKISGRVPLEQSFPELREFFVEVLQVRTIDTMLLIEELMVSSKSRNKDLQEIKRIMLAIGQMLASDASAQLKQETLQSLRRTHFLPVRNGTEILFETPKADFCINDHERYGKGFEGKIKMLDFSYEDLTSLHPLFRCLSITSRYISGLVDTETTVNNFKESRYLTQHLQERAYAFSWYA